MEANASKTERRIILLGKTGDGRSSTVNTILGKETYLATASSVSLTTECESRDEMVDGRKITVIDTPGIFDTHFTEEEVKSLIQSLIECAPGVHALIIVLKVGKYTAQENEIVNKILGCLGENVYKHSVVLFTHGEQLGDQTIKEFIRENKNLQELVDNCGGRCHVIDNKYWNTTENNNNRVNVKYLLETIEKMVEENGLNTIVKCKMANENVLQKLLIRLAGVATGTLTGALFGIAVELALLEIMKFIAAGMDVGNIFAAGALAGAGGGGVVGYNASEKAESVTDAIKMTVERNYENSIYVIKKARQFPYCFKKSKQ